jgi:hypothetical protein
MNTYCFLDCQGGIVGPGLAVILGAGAGAAEEGISWERDEEQDTITTGADGSITHNLNASKTGKIICRFLKTSPTNDLLSAAFNFQTQNGQNHGQNTVTIANNVTGDVITGQQMAFAKMPANSFAKNANVIEWLFTGIVDQSLGSGL